jgi:flagellar basal body rod protein FlgC
MIEATRAYEANVNMVNNAKAMFNKALEIGRV